MNLFGKVFDAVLLLQGASSRLVHVSFVGPVLEGRPNNSTGFLAIGIGNKFTTMQTIFFDIETGPIEEAELAAMMPPFDPNEVKVGNLKDREKIAAKLAEAKAAHSRDFFRRAALDPLTGRVLAIGLLSENGRFSVLGDDEEPRILRAFWAVCRGDMGRLNRMVGFNTHHFDLPFLIRRSFKHRVEVPFGVRHARYWGEEMVDLREVWQLGDRQAHGSLDTIARHLGVGQKNGHGEDFARLWHEDRDKAMAYLRRDLELTARIAGALTSIESPVSRPTCPDDRTFGKAQEPVGIDSGQELS